MQKLDFINFLKGRTVHTHDYKDHQGYEDKNVVIIGIGNSGGDVAVELSRIGKHVSNTHYSFNSSL